MRKRISADELPGLRADATPDELRHLVDQLSPDALPQMLDRIILAWTKHCPHKSFGGMTLEQFKKGVQPSFDVREEIAALEKEKNRLLESLGEAGDSLPGDAPDPRRKSKKARRH